MIPQLHNARGPAQLPLAALGTNIARSLPRDHWIWEGGGWMSRIIFPTIVWKCGEKMKNGNVNFCLKYLSRTSKNAYIPPNYPNLWSFVKYRDYLGHFRHKIWSYMPFLNIRVVKYRKIPVVGVTKSVLNQAIYWEKEENVFFYIKFTRLQYPFFKLPFIDVFWAHFSSIFGTFWHFLG